MNTLTTECPLCNRKVKKIRPKIISCLYCEFEACNTCCENHILQSEQVCCMNTECNKEWSISFITTHFTQRFVNQHLKHYPSVTKSDIKKEPVKKPPDHKTKSIKKSFRQKLPTSPKKIYEHLNCHMIGQEVAKKALSVAV